MRQYNLKQIGIALQGYHDAYQTLPSGYLSAFTADGTDTGPGWGWAALLLDHLEHGTLRVSCMSTSGSKTCRMPRSARHCSPSIPVPSDPIVPTWSAMQDPEPGRDSPGADLRRGIGELCGRFGTSEPGIDGEGLFFRNSRINLRDITDGTSLTLAIGERSHLLGEATWVGSVTGLFLPARSKRQRWRGGRGSRARLEHGARACRRTQEPRRPDRRCEHVLQPASPGREFRLRGWTRGPVADEPGRERFQGPGNWRGGEAVSGQY